MKVQPILASVLSEIKPDERLRKQLTHEIRDFLLLLNRRLKKYCAKAQLGGSFAKDTWLREDHDVDMFIKFHLKNKGKNLSDLLAKALKPWKAERVHGSRDYFWIQNKLRYEIVPVLDIKKPKNAENVMDFSPLHVAWVSKHGKKFKDDIRLAKKFCKANRVYGAESYIRGFSGHVLDILVIDAKGFVSLLKKAVNWKDKVVVDVMNAHKGKALFMLNASKIQGPLVVVDPVQPGRNASAALAKEPFERFIKLAKEFLRKPSKSFFEEKKFDSRGKIIIKVETLDEKEDIAGTKFVSAFSHLKEKLGEFGIADSGWEWDRKKSGIWWFALQKERLSETFDHQGPPLKMKQYAQRFRKLHRKVFVKNGKLYAVVKREHTTAAETIRQVLKDEQVKSKVKKAEL